MALCFLGRRGLSARCADAADDDHITTTHMKRARRISLYASRKTTLVKEQEERTTCCSKNSFDPLGLAAGDEEDFDGESLCRHRQSASTNTRARASSPSTAAVLLAGSSAAAVWSTAAVDQAVAATSSMDLNSFQNTGLTPETFKPVCVSSDAFYRLLQQTAQALVGSENFAEYGPLIASGLLRVRLELCVVESFATEAVGPFIRDNGLSWVLPLHETVETFLAGGIFAIATTFILIGSTKLLTVIVTYADFILGLPSRLLGGFTFDRAQGKPVTVDLGVGPFKTRVIGPKDATKEGAEQEKFNFLNKSVPTIVVLSTVLVLSGILKAFGETLGLVRDVLEAVDSFVGRYLVLWATGYLIIKFLHFKVFPDFPPF